jgi:hypothetical protein
MMNKIKTGGLVAAASAIMYVICTLMHDTIMP